MFPPRQPRRDRWERTTAWEWPGRHPFAVPAPQSPWAMLGVRAESRKPSPCPWLLDDGTATPRPTPHHPDPGVEAEFDSESCCILPLEEVWQASPSIQHDPWPFRPRVVVNWIATFPSAPTHPGVVVRSLHLACVLAHPCERKWLCPGSFARHPTRASGVRCSGVQQLGWPAPSDATTAGGNLGAVHSRGRGPSTNNEVRTASEGTLPESRP